MTTHSFPTYGAYLLGRLTERGLSAADLAAGITYRDRAGVRHPTTEAVLNWIRKSTMPRRELVTATALFFGDDPAEVHAFFRGVREPPLDLPVELSVPVATAVTLAPAVTLSPDDEYSAHLLRVPEPFRPLARKAALRAIDTIRTLAS